MKIMAAREVLTTIRGERVYSLELQTDTAKKYRNLLIQIIVEIIIIIIIRAGCICQSALENEFIKGDQ